MTPRPRVLVCGAGSIGVRHIENLCALGADVSVWRARTELLADVAKRFPVQVRTELAAALDAADAVVVATATDQHLPIAMQVLRAGKALFIEKPLSHDSSGIDELAASARGAIVEVGCQLRAHPNLIALARSLQEPDAGRVLTYRLAMGHRLDAWRPASDYRQGYSADAARGGGALFDLIHQIDIALWLFGSVAGVQAALTKRSDLQIQGDDVTNLLLSHGDGFAGHVQLDMASPVYRCDAEVVTTNALFRWSLAEGILRRHTSEGNKIVHELAAGHARNDLFVAHMTHFLRRLRDATLEPLCSLEDGIAALRVALAARRAHETGVRAIP